TLTAASLPLPPLLDNRGDEGLPALDLTTPRHRLRAMRIVEAEDARLLDGAGGAEARRMIGIALDLYRPPHLMLEQDAGRIAIERGRGGVVAGAGGNDAGRLLDIRPQLARLLLGPARGEAAQRHRCRHELKEASAVERAGRRRGKARELLLDMSQKLRRLRQLCEALPVGRAAPVAEAPAKRGDIEACRRGAAHR